MTLVRGPSGNLLLAPAGLANSKKCCCCDEECGQCPCCYCIECADGLKYALPRPDAAACNLTPTKATLLITLSSLTLSTACRTYRDANCNAAPGTFASYKINSSSMADLQLPFCWDTETPHAAVPDPDSICDDLTPVCEHWKMCVSLPDTGITFTQYTNSNCTGSSNTAALRIAGAWLKYQVSASGATRRFVLYVTALVGSAIQIPIFLGAVSFDARQCSNYSAWPLTVSNGIGAIACVCGASGEGKHTLATGGNATLALACDLPACDGGASPMGSGGEPLLVESFRDDERGAVAAITARKKKGCCL